MKTFDVAIVGAGLVGLSLACALRRSALKVAIIDAQPLQQATSPADFDSRTLALTASSRTILDSLQIPLSHQLTPIATIHVSERGGLAATRLQAAQFQLPALGYTLAYRDLHQELCSALRGSDTVTWFCPAELSSLVQREGGVALRFAGNQPAIFAKLCVGADGSRSWVRRCLQLPQTMKDYQQHALVAHIGLARCHGHTAYERFTPEGPLAMLPLSDQRAALVWCAKPATIDSLMQLSETAFLERLQECFGYRLGRFTRLGRRQRYPLQLVTTPRQMEGSCVLLGNAVHTLHPVAGQGFNLSLRDAAELATACVSSGNDFHPAAFLADYLKKRQLDQQRTIEFTDGLVQLFSWTWPGSRVLRGLALSTLDCFPGAKALLMRQSMGRRGPHSPLAAGAKLDLHDSLV